MVLGHVVAPEMAMAHDDCRELSKAISDVNRHYQIQLLDQKTADWFHLIQLVGVAYGTRFMAIRARRRAPTRIVPRPQSGPVPGNPAPPNLDLTETGMNGVSDRAVRTGEVAGIGKIEFPPDHDLAPRKH